MFDSNRIIIAIIHMCLISYIYTQNPNSEDTNLSISSTVIQKLVTNLPFITITENDILNDSTESTSISNLDDGSINTITPTMDLIISNSSVVSSTLDQSETSASTSIETDFTTQVLNTTTAFSSSDPIKNSTFPYSEQPLNTTNITTTQTSFKTTTFQSTDSTINLVSSTIISSLTSTIIRTTTAFSIMRSNDYTSVIVISIICLALLILLALFILRTRLKRPVTRLFSNQDLNNYSHIGMDEFGSVNTFDDRAYIIQTSSSSDTTYNRNR